MFMKSSFKTIHCWSTNYAKWQEIFCEVASTRRHKLKFLFLLLVVVFFYPTAVGLYFSTICPFLSFSVQP